MLTPSLNVLKLTLCMLTDQELELDMKEMTLHIKDLELKAETKGVLTVDDATEIAYFQDKYTMFLEEQRTRIYRKSAKSLTAQL